MAGLFGFFDYSKPGPGVEKDEHKAPVPLFFELFFRKFWDLLKLNILFFIFNIPAMLTMIFVFLYILDRPFTNDPLNDLIFKFILGISFILIPIFTVGPAQCGFTYVLRNFVRQEHSFIWWDFKQNAKRNWKEGTIISLIDLVAFSVVLFDIKAYSILGSGNMLLTIASGFFLVAFVVYIMMHMYIYPMLVTFKLSVKQVIKNSLFFALMKFLPNLGILLLCALIIGGLFFINPMIGIFLLPFIMYSMIGFLVNFYVYPQLKKYMMDKAELQAPVDKNNI